MNEKCHILTRIYYNFKGNKRGLIAGLHFTPLESPAARGRVLSTCSGDEPCKTSGLLRGEDRILLGANTGFKAPSEPSRWKVEDLLTGFNEMWA